VAETKKALSQEAKAKYTKAAEALKASSANVRKIAAGIAALDKNVEELDKVLE
jgi:hypothetical protein